VVAGDREVPRKQRHTARWVWQRLVAEHHAEVAEVTVSRYVACRRVELGLDRVQVAVPQTHPPGAEAEVDLGEFYATVAGTWIKLWMFVMRLSHCGRAFHVAFATQAQEAFLEGHVAAFAHFGAVPGRIRYDNLKPAVIRVLRGRDLTESEGSSRCAATTATTGSSASPEGRTRTRRAVSRVRSAGSAAATSCRSRTSGRWPS
jgi:transposase